MNRDLLLGAAVTALLVIAFAVAVSVATDIQQDRPPRKLLQGDRLVEVGPDWILTRCDGAYGAVVLGRIGGDAFATHEPYDNACADLNRPEPDQPDRLSNDA